MFILKNKTAENGKIIKGAALLAAGAFIAKLIGALYRIPLTNMLKSEGIGLYQMVFPVYTLLLEFSGAGVPAALSVLISGYSGEYKEEYARRVLKNAVKLFAAFGGIGMLFLIVFGKPLSALQGDSNAVYGYLFMAPAVFFTAIISCYRGYFQGLMNMSPTAVSQIIEQVIKLSIGLMLVSVFLPDVPLAVGGATLAVSLSELFALIYLFIIYKRKNKNCDLPLERAVFPSDIKKIISFVIPITLVGSIIPLSHISDSFFIINILSGYKENATSLYGLLSGAANTVINLPVSMLFAFATVTLPAVASAKRGETEEKEKITIFSTLIISVVFAAFCYFLSPIAVKILFYSLSPVDKGITVRLIKLTSGNVVFLSVLQTVNSVHIARKKPYTPLIGTVFGVILKTVLYPILLKNPSLNIYGGAVCFFACYFSACLINLILLMNFRVKDEVKKPYGRETAC